MSNPFQALLEVAKYAPALLSVATAAPGIAKAIWETYEAYKVSGALVDDEIKIKEATEAGQAWLDVAVNQLQVKPAIVDNLRNKSIPAFAELLFHGVDHG